MSMLARGGDPPEPDRATRRRAGARRGAADGGWPPPAPGAAPRTAMIAAQAGLELRTLVRNGEQLLLTVLIPVVLLAGFSLEPLIKGTGDRLPGARHPGPGHHLHRLHQPGDRRPASSGATAC